jgi:hypothetical protein
MKRAKFEARGRLAPTFQMHSESNTGVNQRPQTYLVLFLFFGSIVGCGESKPITDEELRSEIQSIISIASEANLFLAQVQQQKVTRTFASEHLKYLTDQNDETLSDLAKASGTQRNDSILRETRAEARQLSAELATLSTSVSKPSFDSANRIAQILDKAQQLRTSLR